MNVKIKIECSDLIDAENAITHIARITDKLRKEYPGLQVEVEVEL